MQSAVGTSRAVDDGAIHGRRVGDPSVGTALRPGGPGQETHEEQVQGQKKSLALLLALLLGAVPKHLKKGFGSRSFDMWKNTWRRAWNVLRSRGLESRPGTLSS